MSNTATLSTVEYNTAEMIRYYRAKDSKATLTDAYRAVDSAAREYNSQPLSIRSKVLVPSQGPSEDSPAIGWLFARLDRFAK